MSDHKPESGITLEFLAQHQRKPIGQMADQRADMAGLLALVQRMDATMHGLLREVLALHGQIGRFGYRLRQIEEAKP